MLGERKNELKNIQEFLGLPEKEMSVETAKMRRRPLSEVIENFEKVKKRAGGHKIGEVYFLRIGLSAKLTQKNE